MSAAEKRKLEKAPKTLKAAPGKPVLERQALEVLYGAVEGLGSDDARAFAKVLTTAEFTVAATSSKYGRKHAAFARARADFKSKGHYRMGELGLPVRWLFARDVEATGFSVDHEVDTRSVDSHISVQVRKTDVSSRDVEDATAEALKVLERYLPNALAQAAALLIEAADRVDAVHEARDALFGTARGVVASAKLAVGYEVKLTELHEAVAAAATRAFARESEALTALSPAARALVTQEARDMVLADAISNATSPGFRIGGVTTAAEKAIPLLPPEPVEVQGNTVPPAEEARDA